MEKLKLTYSHQGAIAHILLDDGKGNVLDDSMMREMLRLFDRLRANRDLKMVTFQGAGKHFSFGASVAEHQRDQASSMLRTFHQLFYTLMDMSIPTMAKISGQCLGGGLELALFCNFLFADKSAVLGQPEIVLGVFPPPASVILPMKIGQGRADELLLTGRAISAEAAAEWGLLTGVFDDKEALQAGVDEWLAKHIVPKSASSLRYGVQAARSAFNRALREQLPLLEKYYVEELMETRDANEGIGSFLEKRKPVWENR